MENLFITAAYAAYGNQKQFNDEFDNLFQLLQLDKQENYYTIAGNRPQNQNDKNRTARTL